MQQFCDVLIDFGPKNGIPVFAPRKLAVGIVSKISIYQRSTGRWMLTWNDEHPGMGTSSFRLFRMG